MQGAQREILKVYARRKMNSSCGSGEGGPI